jgi:hypothetical protein
MAAAVLAALLAHAGVRMPVVVLEVLFGSEMLKIRDFAFAHAVI